MNNSYGDGGAHDDCQITRTVTEVMGVDKLDPRVEITIEGSDQ